MLTFLQGELSVARNHSIDQKNLLGLKNRILYNSAKGNRQIAHHLQVFIEQSDFSNENIANIVSCVMLGSLLAGTKESPRFFTI